MFVECRGRLAKASARYPPLMARVVWDALRPKLPRSLVCAMPPEAGNLECLSEQATRPLWCALITRTVPTKSAEAKSDKAQEAIRAEVRGHGERGTWDIKRVRSLRDWMNDTSLVEVLVGRVFVILGCKNSEMLESEWRYRARAVFQGNNIQTRFWKISLRNLRGRVEHARVSRRSPERVCGRAVARLLCHVPRRTAGVPSGSLREQSGCSQPR